jgi:hypothetical protein
VLRVALALASEDHVRKVLRKSGIRVPWNGSACSTTIYDPVPRFEHFRGRSRRASSPSVEFFFPSRREACTAFLAASQYRRARGGETDCRVECAAVNGAVISHSCADMTLSAVSPFRDSSSGVVGAATRSAGRARTAFPFREPARATMPAFALLGPAATAAGPTRGGCRLRLGPFARPFYGSKRSGPSIETPLSANRARWWSGDVRPSIPSSTVDEGAPRDLPSRTQRIAAHAFRLPTLTVFLGRAVVLRERTHPAC